MRACVAWFALLGCLVPGCSSVDLEDDVSEVEPAPVDGVDGKADLFEGNVEIKLTFRADEIDDAVSRFHLDADRASEREVYFYDTCDLHYSTEGLVLRARRIDGADDDSTVKWRPMDAALVDPWYFELDGFKCEEDRTVGQSVLSCSLTVVQDRGEIGEVADGDREIDRLFSGEQETFADDYGAAPVDWTALEVLGPVEAQVWRVRSGALDRRLTFELWTLPDGTELLEVSTRVTSEEADDAQEELVEYLSDRGFDTASEGDSKTRAALDYFAGC